MGFPSTTGWSPSSCSRGPPGCWPCSRWAGRWTARWWTSAGRSAGTTSADDGTWRLDKDLSSAEKSSFPNVFHSLSMETCPMNFPTRNVTPRSPSSELILNGKDGQFNNTLITALNSVWTISFVLAICHILPYSTLKRLKKSFVPQKLTCKSLARLHSRCASQDEPAIDRISTFASNFPHHFVSTKCYLCHSHV